MKPGTRNLITDVSGLVVGNAQDHRLKSGVTVVTADQAFVASVMVMGGAPGTRETDLLAPDKLVDRIDALVLSGGSAFGLDAASGVADELRATGHGYPVGPKRVPLVPAAILLDLLNGGDKDWGTNPYRDLGKAALQSAGPEFDIGTFGAGTGALTGMQKGGLGSASLVLDNGTTVGALVAVNPVGSVTTQDDKHFWAAPFEIDNEFGGLGPDPSSASTETYISRKSKVMAEHGNTTIAIVATDATLTKAQAYRVAVAAHDGIARAIVPSHTPFDGDLVFSVATGRNQTATTDANLMHIGAAAASCLSRAIARGVFHARPAPGDIMACWSD